MSHLVYSMPSKLLSSGGGLRSSILTLAPRDARIFAVARPIPEEPPGEAITFSLMDFLHWGSHQRLTSDKSHLPNQAWDVTLLNSQSQGCHDANKPNFGSNESVFALLLKNIISIYELFTSLTLFLYNFLFEVIGIFLFCPSPFLLCDYLLCISNSIMGFSDAQVFFATANVINIIGVFHLLHALFLMNSNPQLKNFNAIFSSI